MISPQEQWNRMIRLTELFLTQGAEDTELSEKYIAMLEYLKDDQLGDHRTLGMMRAPASAHRHHAFEGGLVAHILQMWDIWTGLSQTIRVEVGNLPDMMDQGFIWRAILHHDLNKVWKYDLQNENPWEVSYARDSLTSLLTDTHKSLNILSRSGIHLPVALHNALIIAEGGYSAARPKSDTVLGKVVYLLDELSANVVDRLQRGAFWDSKVGGISEVP